MYKIETCLTFDDVLLSPKYSDVTSRKDIDTSVKIKDFKFSNPIIPANMQTITGEKMALTVASNGGLAILHRFMPLGEQLDILDTLKIKSIADGIDYFNHVGVSVGVKPEDYDNVHKFVGLGTKIICVDIAHAHSYLGLKMTNWIKKTYPNLLLISGNIATAEGAKALWDNGADVVKCGIGDGSLCSTRIETGAGVPQLSALINVFEAKTSNYQYIISDGGIKRAGEIVKACCFADMVMSGSLFAGCVETPGKISIIGDKSYKEYRGSSTHKDSHVEGVVAIIPTKGKYKNILTKLLEGLVSGMSYQGVFNLEDLKVNPSFIRITNAGLIESHPKPVM